MKHFKRGLALFLILVLAMGCAHAQTYVSIADLRRQTQAEPTDWEVLIPITNQVPVLAVGPDDSAEKQPLVITVGSFDESASGRFQESTRYGKTPSHTALTNGLSLEAAQALLDDELKRLLNKTIDDYGLIWTEIAEWKNMETWLLYYGQRFESMTCFNIGLTMDARNEAYRHMIIPHFEEKKRIYDDVPLAAWPVVMESVHDFLSQHKAAKLDTLELGYLLRESGQDSVLVPVWRLDYMAPNGYGESYFSAQTGEAIVWESEYLLPEPFGWEAAS